MRGQKILLKKRNVVLVLLGGACHSSEAWTGLDIRKSTSAGCSSTVQPRPTHSLRFLEKGWVGAAIIASSLSFGLNFPAFADDLPILTDTEQAQISPIPDQLGFERSNESTNRVIDGKSLAAVSSQGSGDTMTSSLSTIHSETTRQDSSSAGGLSSDKIILVNTGSQSGEEHPNDSLEDMETPPDSAIASADDFHSAAPAQSRTDEGSSPSLEYIDGIAKATLQVVEELDTIPSTSSSEREDTGKHGASTEQSIAEGSTKLNGMASEARLTLSEASGRVDVTSSETDVNDDFVGNDERKLEEEEYVHHELSKEQIEWLRKH